MGNTHVKPHPRSRNKKQVHWKAAARPPPPGKPHLAPETTGTPDVVTIRWTKPLTDGGSPITGYLVEHRRTGSPHWVRASPLLVQVPELAISGLEPGWRYQFRVSADNAVGMSDPSELSEPITVTLQRSAITAPRFTQELLESTALENEKTEFVVHFLGQPAPKICWYKDAYEIFSSRRIRILTESDRSILTIHQCSLSDEGEIKCTATNRAGHVTTKSKLTVEAPPSIRLPRQYEEGLLFEIGELIRLKVSVAGRPTPLVFWTHDGESIKNNDRYEIEHIDKSSSLKIAEARREDRGEYIVKAVNKLGEDIQSFLVTVTDKPSPPGKARVVMALGRSVTLSWSQPSDDGGCKIGNYIVEYYRLGWNVWLKAATSRQLTTMLGDLIEGSEYKFRIKAESPYGVSEPSEESDIVFVPDPKRGILQPPARGRSQPREVLQEPGTPTVARRKKQRSQSSQRPEDKYVEEKNWVNSIEHAIAPKPPERKKIKSPTRTPDASPVVIRKASGANINKEMFDRTSVARDLAYGSPEIKVKKELYPQMNDAQTNFSSGSEISRTPSPTKSNSPTDHKIYTVKIESSQQSPSRHQKEPSPVKALSLSPDIHRGRKYSRGESENLTGSTEFMLVLYPGETEKGQSDLDSDEDLIPPPMSLSAPELGTESPLFNIIRNSASSTELLHERAMIRLYQAAEAEEKELEKRRKSMDKSVVLDIPKIQINSKEDEEIVGLDRKESLRRRMSAGGITQQQILQTQRRYSLKNPREMRKDPVGNKLIKFNPSAANKRDIFANRQRSESEEMEEKVFEDIRKRMEDQGKSNTEKRKIGIVDEENWDEDYESSTEDDSDISEYDKPQEMSKFVSRYDDDSEETYHPSSMRVQLLSDKDPFQILTVRKDPPSPDFVPRPILKKHEQEELQATQNIFPAPLQTVATQNKSRSHSPVPPIYQRNRSQSLVETTHILPDHFKIKEQTPQNKQRNSLSFTPEIRNRPQSPIPPNIIHRDRSQSLIEATQTLPANLKTIFEQAQSPPKPRQRSFSLLPQKELLLKKTESKVKSPEYPKPPSTMHSIIEVAKISGITAASVVIPDKLFENQRAAEEAKVVADHYGDIVTKYSRRGSASPQVHQDIDSLKRVPQNVDTPQIIDKDIKAGQNIFLSKQKEANANTSNYKSNIQEEHSPRRSSFTDHYDTRSPIRGSLMDRYNLSPQRTSEENSPIRSSFTDHYDVSPRRDSLVSQVKEPKRDSLVQAREPRRDNLIQSIEPRRDSIVQPTEPRRDSLVKSIEPGRDSFVQPTEPRRDSLIQLNEPRRESISPPVKEPIQNTNKQVEQRKVSLVNEGEKFVSTKHSLPESGGFSINQTNQNNPLRKDSLINTSYDTTELVNRSEDSQQRKSSLVSKDDSRMTNTRELVNIRLELKTLSPSRNSPSRSRTSSTSSSVLTESNSHVTEKTSKTRIPHRKTSPSPLRQERARKTSPSPMRSERKRKTSPSPLRQKTKRRVSPSPYRQELNNYRPTLKEIMTQTSGEFIDIMDSDYSRTSSPGGKTPEQEELIARAEVHVRSFVDYLTDLAMFAVACWLYLFSNELYAIPVLLFMAYRQLKIEILKIIPNWLLRRLKRKEK